MKECQFRAPSVTSTSNGHVVVATEDSQRESKMTEVSDVISNQRWTNVATADFDIFVAHLEGPKVSYHHCDWSKHTKMGGAIA